MPDGRTVEEALAHVLVEEGLNGRHRVAAVNSIFDRLEGKPKRQLAVDDARKARGEADALVQQMSDVELAALLLDTSKEALNSLAPNRLANYPSESEQP
jgi:hypothetical protein